MNSGTTNSNADEVPETDRHGLLEFYQMLRVMAELHERKSHDYASDEDPCGNYHFAGKLSAMFTDPDDMGFMGRIAEKIYRLSNLQISGKTPLNETAEDTERDICVITVLWMADRRARRKRALAAEIQAAKQKAEQQMRNIEEKNAIRLDPASLGRLALDNATDTLASTEPLQRHNREHRTNKR